MDAHPQSTVEVYDTTLRDGTQQQGISPSVADKLRIAAVLDSLGVGVIEGGWPGANPKDTEFFRAVASGDLALRHASLAAFGMTRRPGRTAAQDPSLTALLDARTPIVTLVGKTWDLHVIEALGTTRAEGVAMVADSVAHLVGEGRRAIFDAEHFFDGYASDPSFALDVLQAAAGAGADTIALCDTNGGTLPDRLAAVVSHVRSVVPAVAIGIHAHDDSGCAVANSLVAVGAGATHVQGTANGIGERCGNANLMSLLPTLQLKEGMPVLAPEALRRLTSVSHEIAEILNLAPDPHAPYVGSAAFAHKAGLHASAFVKRPETYQHVAPEVVGNDARLLVSELAGRATVLAKGAAMGLDLDDATANEVLERVKLLENLGWTFEAAEASFELLVRSLAGSSERSYELEGFRVVVDRGGAAGALAEATVRVRVADERRLGAGEGNGPVDALDHAFRAAVGGLLPPIDAMHLVDYKVRIVDAGRGTGATTRVLVRSSDGTRSWDTVGVSANVIEASWLALADAYDYALLQPATTAPPP